MPCSVPPARKKKCANLHFFLNFAKQFVDEAHERSLKFQVANGTWETGAEEPSIDTEIDTHPAGVRVSREDVWDFG